MILERLTEVRRDDFVSYCKEHRREIDDSFLYDEHLREFSPDDDNPTYLVVNLRGEIEAAASLILNDYYRRGKKGRFRIFHSAVEDRDCYDRLMKSLIMHTDGLDELFLFVPVINEKLKNAMVEQGFEAERYTFLLVRDVLEVPDYRLPENYGIRPFRPGRDEEVWCGVRNAAFATLRGSETPITPDMVAKMVASDDYIEDGLMILYHHEKPVGIVRAAADEYENSPIMNIGPLAIIPEYQGQGLGRSLLRASLHFAKRNAYERTVLCVNAENEKAQALYIQEGFKQVEAVVCYRFDLSRANGKSYRKD
ncbi:GNAT family N-acetyltransferase [Cohnella sp. CFH 77786]|uniref:GNAT family N-acetyltransferase n=1 Tax=Cohnella sp. CFH 77786 TaxID=2662265 RepID=UPI001C610778|nr:GNAT family N-acetyltransferase [Cohnella sp. CFH 77786]MBW5446089.1 GNAT family N-acetyltransferase [Cohnella sp. CFH 77786]